MVDCLDTHIVDHIPQYPCEDCKEVFDTKEDLVKHERDHRDFPYKCRFCNHRAAQLALLRRHLNEEHKHGWSDRFKGEPETRPKKPKNQTS